MGFDFYLVSVYLDLGQILFGVSFEKSPNFPLQGADMNEHVRVVVALHVSFDIGNDCIGIWIHCLRQFCKVLTS